MPLAAALVTAVNAAAETTPVTYLAPGVDAENITESTRFYDAGKGYFYWDSHTDTTRALYGQTGDYSFLGELAKYITETEFSAEAFQPLKNDSATCWYNAGSNAIQYWQDSYAPFYKKDTQVRELPQGYTYARENLVDLAGTQSLRVNMAFYDAWPDQGNEGSAAFEWYLGGKSASSEPGGRYFSDYFAGRAASVSYSLYGAVGGISMEKVTTGILESFGLRKQDDGSLARVEEGLIPTLSAGNNAAAHALTCYGFTLGTDGLVDSLYIADSDDAIYRIEHVYLNVVKDAQGYERLLMFEDAEHTIGWRAEGQLMWGLTEIYRINTPDRLKTLYAQYHGAETPLEWNGESSLWSTETTFGWNVNIEGETYGSGFENGRIVQFGDTPGQRDISVEGAIQAAHMVMDAGSDYSFTGAEGASLRIGTLDKSGHGRACFTDLAIQADTLLLHETGLELLGAASLEIGGAVRISGGTVASTGNAAYNPGNADYRIGSAVMEVTADTDATLRNALDNVRLVNSGTGSLTVDAPITGSFSAEARCGDIAFINCGTGLTVNDFTLHAERTIGIYGATETTQEEETALLITGTLRAEAGARLNADLTLGTGSTLDVSGTGGLGLMLGSSLTLNTGISLSQKDMELIAKMSLNQTYGLFSGVDDLTLAGTDIFGSTDPVSVDAVGWFRGFQPMQYQICYDGSNVGLIRLIIPEPATSALALTALAALAARRRRK